MITFNKFFDNNKFSSFNKISGDGPNTRLVKEFFQNKHGVNHFLLTTSCTHALEMAAILLDIKSGDEIIAPSYTFVSTVNAFVLRGARVAFVDIDPRTMNIDANLIERAITSVTRAIVVVHYAGVACDMNKIIEIANRYKIPVVEDAAQAVMAKYNGKYLGTIGELGAYSFHETKNYTMGEGGALVVNNKQYYRRSEIIREKGTNRSSFLRGQVDKYTWFDIGSSYLPSDILAAYLLPQLDMADEILKNRLNLWNLYHKELSKLTKIIDLPFIPDYAEHNAHMFFIKVKDVKERTELIQYLYNSGIQALFHYVPLHSSPAGLDYGRFVGDDLYTTKESERLLRLPIYYLMKIDEVLVVCETIKSFYSLNF